MKGVMQKRIALGLLVMLAGIVALSGVTGCAQQAAVAKEWEIPVFNCPGVGHSDYFDWSIAYAVEHVNAAGGIAGKPIKITQYNASGDDPQKGLAEVSKVVNNALVILGPYSDPVWIGVMPLVVQNQLMSLAPNMIYETNKEFRPWSISAFPPIEDWTAPPAAAWAKHEPNMKTVVPMVQKQFCWPDMSNGQIKGLKSAGVTVLNEVEVPVGTTTFAPLAVKALDQHPDGIMLSCDAESSAKIINELVNLGWKDPSKIFVFYSGDYSPLYEIAKENVTGCYTYSSLNVASQDPEWVAMVEAYHKKFGPEALPSMINYYHDMIRLVKAAIENTKISGDPQKLAEERIKVRDYILNAKSLDGINSNWNFENGVQVGKEIYLYKITQGGGKSLVETCICK